jgi:hypothetical protein
MALPGSKRLGIAAGMISHGMDNAPDFFGGFRLYLIAAIDGAGDSRRRDSRVFSDFIDIHWRPFHSTNLKKESTTTSPGKSYTSTMASVGFAYYFCGV